VIDQLRAAADVELRNHDLTELGFASFGATMIAGSVVFTNCGHQKLSNVF
jgi:hypothetical protein